VARFRAHFRTGREHPAGRLGSHRGGVADDLRRAHGRFVLVRPQCLGRRPADGRAYWRRGGRVPRQPLLPPSPRRALAASPHGPLARGSAPSVSVRRSRAHRSEVVRDHGDHLGVQGDKAVRASIRARPVRRLELAPPPWLRGSSLRRADWRRSSCRPRPEPSSDQLDRLRVKEDALLVDPDGRDDLVGACEQVLHVAGWLVALDWKPPSRLSSGPVRWSSSASRATPLPACPLRMAQPRFIRRRALGRSHPADIPRALPFVRIRYRPRTHSDLLFVYDIVRRHTFRSAFQASHAGSIPVARSSSAPYFASDWRVEGH